MFLKKRNKLLIIASLSFISVLYTLFFLHDPNALSTTGDLGFHLMRIKGLESIFTSPINLAISNQSGQGINLFYPFLTVLPATLLFHLTHNMIISYILYILLINWLTLFISYYCGLRFFKARYTAFIFSILYTFSAYRATDFFYRTSLAEGVALTFLPLVFLGTYYILTTHSKNWWLLAIGLSLIVYTHLLSALICLLFILFALIVKLVLNRTNLKLIIIDFTKSAFCTLLLTAAFWLPLLEQTIFQAINRPATNILAEKALSPSGLFTEALNNNLAYYGCGFLGLIGILAPLILKNKPLTKNIKLIWGFSAIALLLSTNLFPWRLLQNTPFNIIQFPWRFMGVYSLFYVLVIADIINNITDKKKRVSLVSIILTGILVLTCASSINLRKDLEHDPIGSIINTTNLADIITKRITYYSADYIPKRALSVQDKMAAHKLAVNGQWQKHAYKATQTEYKTTINGANKEIIIPLYSYKGVHVSINQKPAKLTRNSYGLVSFATRSTQNNIIITYNYTRLATIAMIISALTIFSLSLFIVHSKRKL